MKEDFVDVVGYEDYFMITKSGVVFSKKLKREVKLHITNKGYVAFTKRINGKNKTLYLHKVLAETFIPNPDNKPEVNHIDGNKQNYSLENLEWVTHQENSIHAHSTGLQKATMKHMQKLSSEDVQYILENYKPKDKMFGEKAMAKKFGVDKSRIWYIVKNNGYKT